MSLSRTQFVCFALAVSIPFAAHAQEQPAVPKLTEQIEVRIANVDVIVTDRAGKPVAGLTKDDFEIVENKIAQPIVNFFEARPDATAAVTTASPTGMAPVTADALPATPAPPRRVVFYIDNLSLTGSERNQLLAEMKTFVNDMRPGDEVMIATFNRMLRIPLTFTSDREQITAALGRIAGESASGETRLNESFMAQQDIHASGNHEQRVFLAKAYAQTVLNDVQQSAKAVKTLMTNLAGLEGKKVLVLASEGFPVQPGVEMFEYIDRLGDEVSSRDEIQFRLKNPPEVRGSGGTVTAQPAIPPPMPGMTKMLGSAMVNAREFSAEKVIESIGSAANANGVTLYTIHAGALDGGTSAGADRSRAISNTVAMHSRSNAEAGLKSLAELTGGLASVTASKHQGLFEGIRRDLDSYYSLGYRSAPGEGERTLQVRMKKGGRYIVRTRRTHVQKSLEQDMSDRVIANLLSKPRGNDLNVSITTEEEVETAQGKIRVPVKIHVPMDSLTLLEQTGGRLEGGFDVFVVVADKGGSLSPVVHRTQRVGVAADQKESSKGTNYTYSLDFLMNREAARVSVAIVDSTTNVTSFARYDR
jgi:VWFA-related protein